MKLENLQFRRERRGRAMPPATARAVEALGLQARLHSAVNTTAPAPTLMAVTKPPPANGKRPPPIVVYPTVSPESIVVPIVSCIFGFPLLALTVICCLRRRAKLARERARRRNCELDRGELSVVRVSPIKRNRAVSLVRSPRPLPNLELDTVLEEKSDPEQTQVEMMTPDREVSAILFTRNGANPPEHDS